MKVLRRDGRIVRQNGRVAREGCEDECCGGGCTDLCFAESGGYGCLSEDPAELLVSFSASASSNAGTCETPPSIKSGSASDASSGLFATPYDCESGVIWAGNPVNDPMSSVDLDNASSFCGPACEIQGACDPACPTRAEASQHAIALIERPLSFGFTQNSSCADPWIECFGEFTGQGGTIPEAQLFTGQIDIFGFADGASGGICDGACRATPRIAFRVYAGIVYSPVSGRFGGAVRVDLRMPDVTGLSVSRFEPLIRGGLAGLGVSLTATGEFPDVATSSHSADVDWDVLSVQACCDGEAAVRVAPVTPLEALRRAGLVRVQ